MSASVVTVGTGTMSPTRPWPSTSKPGARLNTGIPSVTISAKPRAMPIIPSVAMKGGMPEPADADAVGGPERGAAQ